MQMALGFAGGKDPIPHQELHFAISEVSEAVMPS
jgi:hypothetical protein